MPNAESTIEIPRDGAEELTNRIRNFGLAATSRLVELEDIEL